MDVGSPFPGRWSSLFRDRPPTTFSLFRNRPAVYSETDQQFMQKPTTPCSRRVHAVCTPFTRRVNQVTDELCGLLPRVTASLGSVLIELPQPAAVTDRYRPCSPLLAPVTASLGSTPSGDGSRKTGCRFQHRFPCRRQLFHKFTASHTATTAPSSRLSAPANRRRTRQASLGPTRRAHSSKGCRYRPLPTVVTVACLWGPQDEFTPRRGAGSRAAVRRGRRGTPGRT